jgi:hypothetical protein
MYFNIARRGSISSAAMQLVDVIINLKELAKAVNIQVLKLTSNAYGEIT